MKILVVEDDELVGDILAHILTEQNYAVEIATDGQTGWSLVEAFDYDLILLDILLPKLDGITLCRKIRSAGVQTPILLLTGCSNGHDKAIGLDAGADDYVVKPFDQEELVARIRALLRRGTTGTQPVLEWGNLQLDPSSCQVTYNDKVLALTPKEYALLELFLRNHRRVFSCSMILEHLWSYEEVPGEEAVRTHIKGLRQKLKAVGCPADLVETVYGIGYRLKPRESSSSNRSENGRKALGNEKGRKQERLQLADTPSKESTSDNSEFNSVNDSATDSESHSRAGSTIDQSVRRQTLTLVNAVWHRFKDRISTQIQVLAQAATALRQGELEQTLQQQARQEAHSLAGALGTFGLMQGSQIAKQLEDKFQAEQPFSPEEIEHLQQWVAALQQEIRWASQKASEGDPLEDDRPLLLVVDSDYALAEQLMIEAPNWGLRVEMVVNLARAKDKIYLEQPSIVLLDPAITPSITDSQLLLDELKKHVPPIPPVICTAQAALTHRLELLHLGGHTFLQKPTAPAHILEVVTQVLQQAERSKDHVMIVDDDPSILATVRALLEPWGFKITTLNNPQQFWQVLETSSPDLLILDIEMPYMNGIELCQIVRSDSRWSDLPILILTVHNDPETVNQVFRVGADDFVGKPIVGPELVTRTVNRLERMKLLKRRYAKAQDDALQRELH